MELCQMFPSPGLIPLFIMRCQRLRGNATGIYGLSLCFADDVTTPTVDNIEMVDEDGADPS